MVQDFADQVDTSFSTLDGMALVDETGFEELTVRVICAAWHKVEGSAYTPPIACPCTTQLLCDLDERDIMPQDCKMPEWFRMVHHIDGGAGALLSHGLLEALDGTFFEACVTSGGGVAGDYLLTYCMWQSGWALHYIPPPNTHTHPSPGARLRERGGPGSLAAPC